MITAHDKEIQSLVGDIRDGKLLLPELQREYVWKAPQVRNLFDSLYRQYPSGQFLVWETDQVPITRTVSLEALEGSARRPQLLLDGQQRLTSLSAIMLGRPLEVRGSKRPIDIAFNVHSETFEVAGPRQGAEAGWVSLRRVFTENSLTVFNDLNLDPRTPEGKLALERLIKLEQVKSYKYRVIVLEHQSYEEVTDIFVRINSGGSRLGTADLAVAQVSSRWRGVTEEFNTFRDAIKSSYRFEIDNSLFIRSMSLFLTGQSRLDRLFAAGRAISIEDLEDAWKRSKAGFKQALEFVVNNCRIDRLGLLPSPYFLVTLASFFDRHGANISVETARGLQRWVYLSLIWSRYSTSTETKLDQDQRALVQPDPISSLVQNIEDQVGSRPVTEREFQEQRANSAFMLMAYVLARMNHAQDWFNGVVIGPQSSLEFHHIFPKAVLKATYDLKKQSRTVDQVANLALLSENANKRISGRSQSEYLAEIEQPRLHAQAIPLDRKLWALERFEDFVRERRSMLAEATNGLLRSLAGNTALVTLSDTATLDIRVTAVEHQLRDLIADRIAARGDLAWAQSAPTELQEQVSRRVAQRVRQNPFEESQHEGLEAKLAQCQFSDYLSIVEKRTNWPLFQDVFGTSEQFRQHFGAVREARNALAHHRDLNEVERPAAEAGLRWLEKCLQYARDRNSNDDLASEQP